MINTDDLTQALIFVEEHGNLQEKARLLYILAGEKPPQSILQPLLDKQNPDGGFPSRPKGDNPSSVDNTITALWQFDELGTLQSPPAERAVCFIEAAQAEDGSWDENPSLPAHDLPPWIVPGELATRLYLTAYAAYWLSITRPSTHSGLQRALVFLRAHQQEQGQIPSYLHANWIAASAFLMSGDGQAAESIIRSLSERPFSEWEDSQIAWALDCFGRAKLPPEHPFVAGSLAELLRRRKENGSWGPSDNPSNAVSATVSALKALKVFGQLPAF